MSNGTLEERRRSPRHPTLYKVNIVVLSGPRAGDELEGDMIDVSKHGLGLRMPLGLTEGDQLGLVIFTDGYESLCVGNVVWKKLVENEGHYGFNVTRWSYLDPALGNQL